MRQEPHTPLEVHPLRFRRCGRKEGSHRSALGWETSLQTLPRGVPLAAMQYAPAHIGKSGGREEP